MHVERQVIGAQGIGGLVKSWMSCSKAKMWMSQVPSPKSKTRIPMKTSQWKTSDAGAILVATIKVVVAERALGLLAEISGKRERKPERVVPMAQERRSFS